MGNQTKFIRDTVLRHLHNERNFNGMIIAEINGCNFSAADIALPDSDNRCQVYRLMIIKYG